MSMLANKDGWSYDRVSQMCANVSQPNVEHPEYNMLTGRHTQSSEVVARARHAVALALETN